MEHHPINVERRESGLTYTNVVLLRGCGKRLDVEPFDSRYQLNSFMIAPTAIIRGIGGFVLTVALIRGIEFLYQGF